jgi:uncharacterized protein
MKVSLRQYFLVAVLLVSPGFLRAQEVPAGISVRANVKENVIQLRWAVNTPMAWKQLNKYGYIVERYTVVRDGEILALPEKVVITASPLKPQPLNNWEQLATSNNYAAVIAQALYGEEFKLSDAAKGVSGLIALAQELEQRHLISLYAADLCYPAALLAGWGYEDKTVKKNERYLYRVVSAVPEKTLKIEMGSVYISLKEVTTLPQPQELTAIFGDRSVLLAWNYGMLNTIYNAYYLEKSTDGKTFKRISDIPLTNMNSKDGKAAERMFYTDSLAQNHSVAYYRLIGVTPFSEEGPPSDAVKGEGSDRLMYVPHIHRAVPDSNRVLTVEWEFDERGNEQLKSFELHRSDNVKGPYSAVRKNISPTLRSVTFDSLQSTNYFVIAAIPRDGEPVQSFPVLVQPSDTVPPAMPTGLRGVVDTLGVVRLDWTPNTDSDIYGYRVYRAQTDSEELVPLTDDAVHDNFWVDTVDVRNLNSKVYYAVSALDKRYNQSPKTPAVIIQKPELVPPSTPIITNYKLTPTAIILEWATGGEDNLAAILLYRAKRGDKLELLKTFTPDIRSFKDSTLQSDQYYTYGLIARSIGEKESKPSPPITIQAPLQAGNASKLSDFKGKYIKKKKEIELAWSVSAEGVKQLELYRNDGGKGFALLKTLKGYERTTTDQNVQPGNEYEYMLRIILENGRGGAIAKTTVGIKQ